jgi:hypothetical protein
MADYSPANRQFLEQARREHRDFTVSDDYGGKWRVTWNADEGWREAKVGTNYGSHPRKSMDHFEKSSWTLEWAEPQVVELVDRARQSVDPVSLVMRELRNLVVEYDAGDTVFGSEVKKFAEARM